MANIVDNSYRNYYKAFLDNELSRFVDDFIRLMHGANLNARYYFAGNGASAAIASHLANDFTKAVGLRASTFHDPAMLTCFGNDFGYDNWIAEAVRRFGDPGDILILISSSGQSTNILKAASAAKENGLVVVALTGPTPSEKLVKEADLILKIQSKIYNVIENCHMMALCAVVDSCNLISIAD